MFASCSVDALSVSILDSRVEMTRHDSFGWSECSLNKKFRLQTAFLGIKNISNPKHMRFILIG